MNFKKKIIYLIDQPLDDFNIERFFINEIEKKGWIVEIWDFTKIYHKIYYENYYKDRYKINDKRVIMINKFDEFQIKVTKNEKNTFYFDFLSQGAHYFIYKLRKFLKKNKKIRIVFASGLFPVPNYRVTFIDIVKKNSFKSIFIKTYINLIIKYFAYFNKPDIYFSSGYQSTKNLLSNT